MLKINISNRENGRQNNFQSVREDELRVESKSVPCHQRMKRNRHDSQTGADCINHNILHSTDPSRNEPLYEFIDQTKEYGQSAGKEMWITEIETSDQTQ